MMMILLFWFTSRGRTIIGSVSNPCLKYLANRYTDISLNDEGQWGDAVIARLCALISVRLTTVATARQAVGRSGECGARLTERRPLREEWGREAPDGWVSCSSRRGSPTSWQTGHRPHNLASSHTYTVRRRTITVIMAQQHSNVWEYFTINAADNSRVTCNLCSTSASYMAAAIKIMLMDPPVVFTSIITS